MHCSHCEWLIGQLASAFPRKNLAGHVRSWIMVANTLLRYVHSIYTEVLHDIHKLVYHT